MKDTPQNDPSQPARTITLLAAIAAMHDQRFAQEIEDNHKSAVAHIVNKGGKGRITITLDYGAAEEGVNITGDVTLKLPKKSRRAEFVYADSDGKTYQDSPVQAELKFPTVVKETAARKNASV